MLFTKADLSLEHLPPFDDGFDPDEYISPRSIFLQSTFSGFPKIFHFYATKKLSEDFLDCDWYSPLRLTQIAWQAFFDQIDFYSIDDEVTLEFFVNMPKLTEVDPANPVVILKGYLGRKIYRSFSDIKAINDGAAEFEHFIQDTDNLLALKLLDNGYFPESFSMQSLVLKRDAIPSRRTNAEIEETRRLRDTAISNRPR